VKNLVHLDEKRRRLVVRAHGQWTTMEASWFRHEIEAARDWSRSRQTSISIFSDLSGLKVHTADVAVEIELAVSALHCIRVDRHALVVPSFLKRMQCRRLLAGTSYDYADEEAEAFRRLDWEEGYEAPAISPLEIASASMDLRLR
jgi:hypothetical protein